MHFFGKKSKFFLVNSKKSSTFAADFEPCANEIEHTRLRNRYCLIKHYI